MATVLVVDDDPNIRAMLLRALRYEGYDVTAADGAEAARAAFARGGFDAILLDVRLPDGDGFRLLEAFRRSDPTVPILMLTARDDVESRVRGLDLGADDYVPKPFHLSELLARLRAQLRRRAVLAKGGVLRYADVEVDLGARKASRGGRPIPVTGKAFELLVYFLEHPEQVLAKEAILARLWGPEADTGPNAVEVYVAQLRQKLEEGGRPRLIHTVRGVGYVLREDER